MKRNLKLLSCLSFILIVSCTTRNNNGILAHKKNPLAKNVIFMIVDGMGLEYVKAARIFNGNKPLNIENFPCQTKVTTCPFEGLSKNKQCLKNNPHVTDSAASATAMATGHKVSNGVISKAIPNGGKNLETILERFKKLRKSTGIIATKLITDATPAAFASHAANRKATAQILKDMFQNVLPHVVLGADESHYRTYVKDSLAPYKMIHTKKDLLKITKGIEQSPLCNGDDCPYVYGGFGIHPLIKKGYEKLVGLPLEIVPDKTFNDLGVPHLSNMTDAALKILKKNENGFFLMVESSMPDIIGHLNSYLDNDEDTPSAIEILLAEMREVLKTAQVLKDFVDNNPDTLVILTADHETGGLVVHKDKTKCLNEKNCIANVSWKSAHYSKKKGSYHRHTGSNVPLYAIGKGAKAFCVEQIDNTDIPKKVFYN